MRGAPRRLHRNVGEVDVESLPDCRGSWAIDEEVLERFLRIAAAFTLRGIRLDDVLTEQVGPRICPAMY